MSDLSTTAQSRLNAMRARLAAEGVSQILVYEDTLAQSRRFLPLTYTRAVAELRSGAFTGIERLRTMVQGIDLDIHLHTRKQVAEVARKRVKLPVNEVPQGRFALLNARALFEDSPLDHLEIPQDAEAIRSLIEAGAPIPSGSPINTDRTPLAITALWDLLHTNAHRITADVELLTTTDRVQPIDISQYRGILTEGEVYVHPSVRIGLGTVLDASDGPIILEERARVMPNAVIMGPAVIGKGSLVKASAKIYEGTSIGPVCKVGGEIENAIFQAYSNKQHDGYVGHSFIGEWCNLGADTNTSDLKNDYSPVRVTVEDEEMNTGSLFVGLSMGDHSKSAINTQFNTGTAVGVSCNVFDSGFPPKWIPNFSWGGASGFTGYKFEKAISVAKIVTSRRNVELSREEEVLLRALFEQRNQLDA